MSTKSVSLEKLVSKAIGSLDDRSAKILSGRYGLAGDKPKTLAELGLSYDLTRERVRQIEASALKALLQKIKGSDLEYIAGFLDGYLQGVGDVRRHDSLAADMYLLFSASGSSKRFANELRLLADIIDSLELVEGDDEWHDVWYRDKKAYSVSRKVAEALLTDQGNDFYSFLDDIASKYNLGEFIVLNYLSTSKHFRIGPYGDLGSDNWLHINPKTVRDKSYLVLVKAGEPLHFEEIATRVNALSPKNVHHQTVHNELIKDPRFVLVRRGTYGLKESVKS
ncbi:hypothetical protein M1295_00895 [Patescibacteria group bacterium]|nr:hypothetical protein [Patescibacteria group bacterium]